jgi:L,D-transpeptidase ErfK/SrfK
MDLTTILPGRRHKCPQTQSNTLSKNWLYNYQPPDLIIIDVSTTVMKIILAILLCLSGSAAFAGDMVVGGETIYEVQKRDNLYLIGARYGVFWKALAAENGLDPKAPVPTGTVLRINNRKIVPKVIHSGIIINIPDRTLYLFKNGNLTTFPVALGAPVKGDWSDSRTPTGRFSIVAKRKDPVWHVPESIQIEYFEKGKEVDETVPPGPKNPLGRYALQTSIPGILIHETIWPNSIYRYTSHGCIRMLPEHMEKFFPMVERGLQGEIIYEPVKIAVLNDGRILLEVRTDIYKKRKSVKEDVIQAIQARGLSEKVDWQKVAKMIVDGKGIAEDVVRPQVVLPQKGTTVNGGGRLSQDFFGFFRSFLKFGKN